MDIFNSFENNGIIGLTPELRAKYTYEYFKNSNKSILFVCSSLYEANKYIKLTCNLYHLNILINILLNI